VDDAERYLEHLRTMVNEFRTDLNMPKLPYLAGELGDWKPNYKTINIKMNMIPTTIKNAYLVSSKDLKNGDEDLSTQRRI